MSFLSLVKISDLQSILSDISGAQPNFEHVEYLFGVISGGGVGGGEIALKMTPGHSYFNLETKHITGQVSSKFALAVP